MRLFQDTTLKKKEQTMSLIVGTNFVTLFHINSWILVAGLIVISGVSATPTATSTSLNTPIACAVKLDGGGTCGTNDWDHLNASQTIANGHQYAGCDRDVCNEVCTEDVTRQEFLQKMNGTNEYYCFNTSSILQTTMEGSEIYKYAINCEVETTSGTKYGKFHPGANITDCDNDVLLNTESLCGREMLTSFTTPIACAVKLDGGGTCGTNDWDHLNASQTIANGHQYAGCDRDVCNEVCTEDVTRQEFLQKMNGTNEYYCFNTSSILQTTMEGSEIYKYAINCEVETTSGTKYGKFHPGANITDCDNDVLLNTESLCGDVVVLTSITPPPPSASSTNPPPPLFSGADYRAPGVIFAALITILIFFLC